MTDFDSHFASPHSLYNAGLTCFVFREIIAYSILGGGGVAGIVFPVFLCYRKMIYGYLQHEKASDDDMLGNHLLAVPVSEQSFLLLA
ncbi:hypothetical protein ACJX0J_041453, partial [Zea mays]